jgi:hypothetical protein
MKYLKMLGLAAVAATALMAFGASSASATELCKENVTTPTTCPAASKYGVGTQIHAVLKAGTTATLTSSLVDVHCTGSTVQGEVTGAGGHNVHVKGKIKQLSFTGCKTTDGTNCTVTTVGVNGTTQTPDATVSHSTSEHGNGTMTITPEAGDPNPGATVVCGFFINCTFTRSHIALGVTGGNPATVTATEEELLRSGGFCPEEAFWDASYEITNPKPLFVI